LSKTAIPTGKPGSVSTTGPRQLTSSIVRRGTVRSALSLDGIECYPNVEVTPSVTVSLMAEIDRVIEARGGLPGAFKAD